MVGAIIGWNFFSGSKTDVQSLGTIVSTWIVCPILAGLFAYGIYQLVVLVIDKTKPHLLSLDNNVRWGLILVG